MAQLALAWLLTRSEHIVPISGTRDAGAADFSLSAEDLALIDEILPTGGDGA